MTDIYQGKTAIIINIDHTVRTTISKNFYITDPKDMVIVSKSLPILAALKRQGYTMVGISWQPNLRHYRYNSQSYHDCFTKMQSELGPYCFHQIYFNQQNNWNMTDNRGIIRAVEDFNLARESCLFVGTFDSEVKLARGIGMDAVLATEFFNRIPFRKELKKLDT